MRELRFQNQARAMRELDELLADFGRMTAPRLGCLAAGYNRTMPILALCVLDNAAVKKRRP